MLCPTVHTLPKCKVSMRVQNVINCYHGVKNPLADLALPAVEMKSVFQRILLM